MAGLLKKLAAAAAMLVSTVVIAETRLNGGGATFPDPIYQRWIGEFQKSHPDVLINYQAQGSGQGITGITQKTFDFAGSDAPMSKTEKEKAGGEIVHIPTVAGAVVAAFNIPGFTGDLKLTGPVIADIYLGKISKWNDAAIANINGGTNLPDLAITPVYRSESSGTNFVFTSYLATQSDEFKGKVGVSKQVTWPKGQGASGNPGVTQAVKQTPGAIGYIEVNYATANKILFALVKNKDGNFIKASPKTISAAGEGAVAAMKDSLAVDLWNQSGREAYPISAFTYFIVYKDLSYVKDQAKAKAMVQFMTWALTDGQALAESNDYAPLAPSVQAKAIDALKSLTWGGQAMAAK